jgi:ABC-type sugar transport system ATPase subunit
LSLVHWRTADEFRACLGRKTRRSHRHHLRVLLASASDELAEAIDDREGADLTMGIRPEYIYFTGAIDVKSHWEMFEAVPTVIEPMRSEKFLTLVSTDSNGQKEITARVSPESDMSVNESLWLAIDMKKIHVFDNATGKNSLH